MVNRNVLLYFPHGGTVTTLFLLSLLDALNDPGSPVAEMRELHTGPALGIARNEMTANFLASPHEWLWMTDTDTAFTPRTLPMLLDAADPVNRPVVGALCWMIGPDGKVPTMYEPGERADGKFGVAPVSEWTPGEVRQVTTTGAACLLIHRSVFKRLSEGNPESDGLWWSPLAVDGMEFGEDFSFCFRCADAGVPVYVNTGAETGHVKLSVFGRPRPLQ